MLRTKPPGFRTEHGYKYALRTTGKCFIIEYISDIRRSLTIGGSHIVKGKSMAINMKKTILLLSGTICLCITLLGCGAHHNRAASNDAPPVQNNFSGTEESPLTDEAPAAESENETESSSITNAEELADTFGILILLPENSNWITDDEYYLADENNLRITYHDFITDSDCTLLVSKNNNLDLPQNEYDESLNESWEGKTISGQNIAVKVQHESNDEKTVLATWEYNEYQFAIIGEAKNNSDAIPKTALNIIYNLD